MSAWTGHPDLLGLLRGELSNAEVADAGAHLDECETCRRELGETVVGHAMLTSAARLFDVPATPGHGWAERDPRGAAADAAAVRAPRAVGRRDVGRVLSRPPRWS